MLTARKFILGRSLVFSPSNSVLLQGYNASANKQFYKGKKKNFSTVCLIQNAIMNWTLIKMKGGCVISGFIILNHLLNGFFFPWKTQGCDPVSPRR